MKYFAKHLRHCRFSICLLCSILLSSLIAKYNVIDSTIILKRNSLVEQVDSLNLEKQRSKRNGKSIFELEHQQQILRDTLALLQEKIQNSETIGNNNLSENHFAILKPQTIFDWVILIVGAIAVFSGIFLIFGIFSMLSSKKKKKSRHQTKVAATKPQPQQHQTPAQSIAALQALSDNTSEGNLLRQKLQKANNALHQKVLPKIDILKQEPPIEDPHKNAISSTSDSDIHQKIFDAAQDGMSLHEISKKFHLSTDHVSLILKVVKNWKKSS